MPAFLTPLFLAGLAAVAVPVLVHLLHRERREVVEFPSLMFLRRIPWRSVRRQKLRHRILLALRVLAVVLLAAAFARPFLDRPVPPAAVGAAARDVVILLDRSYSMGAGDRWRRALAAARAALNGLRGGDRAALVAFDAEAAALTAPSSDRAQLRAALDTVRPGHGATRYAPALRLAAELLAESDRPRREVILISDLQRNAWSGAGDARLPAGLALLVVDLSGAAGANAVVTGVEFRRAREAGRSLAVVTARVERRGGGSADLPVTLTLGGRPVQTLPARLRNGVASVAFAPAPVPEGDLRGVVAVAGDALAADDRFHFIVPPAAAIRVLVVAPSAAAALHLRRALELGDRPAFSVTVRRPDAVGDADVRNSDLILAQDALPRGAARAIAGRVAGGAGLIVAAGAGLRVPSDLEPLLPAAPGTVRDHRADGGARLVAFDRSHPALARLGSLRTGGLGAIRFLRSRGLDPTTGASVVARFDDGTPALLERPHGSGRVLVVAAPLDAFWSDLALQPVFLPLVHGLATHAAGWTETRAWRTVGDRLAPPDAAPGRWTVTFPSGARRTLEAGRSVPAAEAGFYELRRAEAGRGTGRVVAVNADRAESDLTAWNAAELEAGLLGPGTLPIAAAAAEPPAPADLESRQAWWRWLLLLVLLVFAAEALLARRLSAAAGEAGP